MRHPPVLSESTRRRLTTAVLVAVLAGPAAVLLAGPVAVSQTRPAGDATSTPSGLRYIDVEPGSGATAQSGQIAIAHYTGWLDDNGRKGRKIDSSLDRGQPVALPLGAGRVIPGVEEGVAGMKVGGRRTLMIPAELAYGAAGAGDGVVPPNSALIFDVELIDLR